MKEADLMGPLSANSLLRLCAESWSVLDEMPLELSEDLLESVRFVMVHMTPEAQRELDPRPHLAIRGRAGLVPLFALWVKALLELVEPSAIEATWRLDGRRGLHQLANSQPVFLRVVDLLETSPTKKAEIRTQVQRFAPPRVAWLRWRND